jgi:hypothetical protein
MPDADHVAVEQRGCPSVIGVVMRIDEIGHLVADPVRGGDLVHGPLDVVPESGWSVEEDDSVICGHEGTLVMLVRNPIEVPLDPIDVVAPLADRRPKHLFGDRLTAGGSVTGRR